MSAIFSGGGGHLSTCLPGPCGSKADLGHTQFTRSTTSLWSIALQNDGVTALGCTRDTGFPGRGPLRCHDAGACPWKLGPSYIPRLASLLSSSPAALPIPAPSGPGRPARPDHQAGEQQPRRELRFGGPRGVPGRKS